MTASATKSPWRLPPPIDTENDQDNNQPGDDNDDDDDDSDHGDNDDDESVDNNEDDESDNGSDTSYDDDDDDDKEESVEATSTPRWGLDWNITMTRAPYGGGQNYHTVIVISVTLSVFGCLLVGSICIGRRHFSCCIRRQVRALDQETGVDASTVIANTQNVENLGAASLSVQPPVSNEQVRLRTPPPSSSINSFANQSFSNQNYSSTEDLVMYDVTTSVASSSSPPAATRTSPRKSKCEKLSYPTLFHPIHSFRFPIVWSFVGKWRC